MSHSHSPQPTIQTLCEEFRQALEAGENPKVSEWMAKAPASLKPLLLPEILTIDSEFHAKKDEAQKQAARNGQESEDHRPRSESHAVPGTGLPLQKFPIRFGRFRIERELGRGGFGIVYLATDTIRNDTVALKIPRDSLDAAQRTRFIRESQATAALNHPGLVPVQDAGEIDGVCFMATAYCSGSNLAVWLRDQESVDPQLAAVLVREMAEAIQHAHSRGVMHRDIKPTNIMVVPHGEDQGTSDRPVSVQITDFGLAKFAEQQMEDTVSSLLMGTPSYMAPEQISGRFSQRRPAAIDIYSLGVVLHELLTKQRPFEEDTVVSTMDSIRNREAEPLRKLRPDVPADLETICLKCLQKDPRDRYASCAELTDDLNRYLRGDSIRARRPGPLQRLDRWSKRPERFAETGAYSIVVAVIVAAWVIAAVTFIAVDKLDARVGVELIPQAFAVIGLLLAPQLLSGIGTLRGSSIAVVIGMVLSVINLVMVVPPLFGLIFVFPDLYTRYPVGRIAVYSLLTLVYSLHALLYAMLMRSLRAARAD